MGFTQERIHEITENQKTFFRSGATLDKEYRIRQLKKLKQAMKTYEHEIEDALFLDLGRTGAEGYFCDIGTVILETNEMIRGLKKWTRPELHFSGLCSFPSVVTRVYKMPYGSVLIISPFNFPFLLSLGVLAAAIAGGNTAVIKASSKSLNCTNVLKKLIADIYPEEYVTVVDGGHDVAAMCLSERFDKIFYTGSPRVASHVMEMASKHLTPVALELGGETGNWCIVRKDADIRDAARKIAFFKLMNAGQVCININQAAVAEEVADVFVEELKKAFEKQIGNAPLDNPEYPKLIGEKAYMACASEAMVCCLTAVCLKSLCNAATS